MKVKLGNWKIFILRNARHCPHFPFRFHFHLPHSAGTWILNLLKTIILMFWKHNFLFPNLPPINKIRQRLFEPHLKLITPHIEVFSYIFHLCPLFFFMYPISQPIAKALFFSLYFIRAAALILQSLKDYIEKHIGEVDSNFRELLNQDPGFAHQITVHDIQRICNSCCECDKSK